MPIYEYRCEECRQVFEKIEFRRESRCDCPDCGSGRTTRLLSSFAVSSSERTGQTAAGEGGPCHCGAPRRGMCQS